MNWVYYLFLMVTLLSCTSLHNKLEDNSSSERIQVQLAGTKFFVIEIQQNSASLNDILVYGKGFPNSSDTLCFENCDPFTSYFLCDLDANGYAELFWQTHSVGSGTYATLYGLASNRDLSYTQIYVPELPINDLRFKDYSGHDYYSIESGKLMQTFPVKAMGKTNATIDSLRIAYKLIAGEAGWIIRPVNQ